LISDHIVVFSFQHLHLQIKLKVICLIADLPARAAVLNVNQFNGYHSCMVCLIKGLYDVQLHKMIFPNQLDLFYRDDEMYDFHVEMAQSTGETFLGVKGKHFLTPLIRNPLQAPLDCMHLIYLGVTKTLTLHLIKKGIFNIDQISSALKSIKTPAYFKRKPRDLHKSCHWKAQEWKQFLLYYICITLYLTNTDTTVISIFLLLSTSIRLLSSEKVTTEHILASEKMLRAFTEIIYNVFGNFAMSYSIHSLCHLPRQVTLFGPLWCTSASAFESAFGFLKGYVTGTKDEANIIVKRYLRHTRLFHKSAKVVDKIVDIHGVCSIGLAVVPSETLSHQFVCCLPYDLTQYIEFYRINVNHITYHSFTYPSKKYSASYLAVAENTPNKLYIKIERILYSEQHNEFICLCTKYSKVTSFCNFLNLDFFSGSLKQCVSQYSNMVHLTEEGTCVIKAMQLDTHFIFINNFFAVSVINDYEHN